MPTELIATNQTTTYGVDPLDEVIRRTAVGITTSGIAVTGGHDGPMRLTVVGSIAGGAPAVLLGTDPGQRRRWGL
jgi:hypothetical protein